MPLWMLALVLWAVLFPPAFLLLWACCVVGARHDREMGVEE